MRMMRVASIFAATGALLMLAAATPGLAAAIDRQSYADEYPPPGHGKAPSGPQPVFLHGYGENGDGSTDGLNGQLVFDRGPAGGDPSEIFIANPDGSAERELTPSNIEGCCAGWSPDGMHLAHPALNTQTGEAGTAIESADGTGVRMLPRPAADIIAACNRWSPEAERLACEVWNLGDESFPSGVFTLRSSDGGDLRRLTTNPYPGGADLAGDYSPSGRQIVFTRFQGGEGRMSALFVVNSDGTHIQQITPWRKVRNTASWSPDGTWILFNDYHGRLWMVHPDGTGIRKLNLDVEGRYFAFEPVWSPDGTRIAFGMWNPTLGQDDIYTARPDGSEVSQVTNTPEHEGNVDWGTYPAQP